METFKFVFGIDVSKDEFHVCFKQTGVTGVVIKGSRSFRNNQEGFVEFLSWSCGKQKKTVSALFVMEATGIYHENLTDYLYHEGCHVSVVLANKIKYFGKSLNIKTKTDKSDASMIASYGLERTPILWKPMANGYKTLRELCRELLSFKRDLVRCKNQYHAQKYAHATSPLAMELKQQQQEFIEKAIATLEREINQLVKEDNVLYERIQKLLAIPGLGMITIIILLCETNGFSQINSIRQLVSYAGLDVSERQSGKFNGKSMISKKGNARIRQCLFMPALSACRHHPTIEALYQRIIEQNPNVKKKGIVAGMRKLLIYAFVLWKKNETYDPNYQWNNNVS